MKLEGRRKEQIKLKKNKMNKAKKISERLEELEEKAKYNRDKWDDTPLTNWLEDDEQEEYERLRKEWNNLN